jgi:hypothetical protein
MLMTGGMDSLKVLTSVPNKKETGDIIITIILKRVLVTYVAVDKKYNHTF